MKLVDILARELEVWPEGLECLSQLKGTGYIINGKGFDGRAFDALQIADETHIAGAIVTRAEWQAAVDALNKPAEPAWNGIGDPASGTVCELRHVSAQTDWCKATIAFASRNVLVWDWDGEPALAYRHAVEVRPVRTPEQIAAEERERDIDKMVSVVLTDNIRANCADLYDAGYRKFEIVDN